MNVLAVIHGTSSRGGVFEDVVRDAGHTYEEWSLAWATPPPRSLDEYGAVIVFGGSMHADQDDRHPWLREENLFIQRLLARCVPLLGVCLGPQLIAKACGDRVYRMPDGPELGWLPVEATEAAARDPLFGRLPERYEAFGWHHYTYDVPAGAEDLGSSPRCNQAFRLGESTWAMQYHAEVTLDTVRSWLDEKDDIPLGLDPDALWAETQAKIAGWNELGRRLCGAFVEVAERSAVGV